MIEFIGFVLVVIAVRIGYYLLFGEHMPSGSDWGRKLDNFIND